MDTSWTQHCASVDGSTSQMLLKPAKKPFICPHCARSFQRPSSLKQHVLIHTKEQPHPCHVCDKRFSVISNLRRHLKSCLAKEDKRSALFDDRTLGQRTGTGDDLYSADDRDEVSSESSIEPVVPVKRRRLTAVHPAADVSGAPQVNEVQQFPHQFITPTIVPPIIEPYDLHAPDLLLQRSLLPAPAPEWSDAVYQQLNIPRRNFDESSLFPQGSASSSSVRQQSQLFLDVSPPLLMRPLPSKWDHQPSMVLGAPKPGTSSLTSTAKQKRSVPFTTGPSVCKAPIPIHSIPQPTPSSSSSGTGITSLKRRHWIPRSLQDCTNSHVLIPLPEYSPPSLQYPPPSSSVSSTLSSSFDSDPSSSVSRSTTTSLPPVFNLSFSISYAKRAEEERARKAFIQSIPPHLIYWVQIPLAPVSPGWTGSMPSPRVLPFEAIGAHRGGGNGRNEPVNVNGNGVASTSRTNLAVTNALRIPYSANSIMGLGPITGSWAGQLDAATLSTSQGTGSTGANLSTSSVVSHQQSPYSLPASSTMTRASSQNQPRPISHHHPSSSNFAPDTNAAGTGPGLGSGSGGPYLHFEERDSYSFILPSPNPTTTTTTTTGGRPTVSRVEQSNQMAVRYPYHPASWQGRLPGPGLSDAEMSIVRMRTVERALASAAAGGRGY